MYMYVSMRKHCDCGPLTQFLVLTCKQVVMEMHAPTCTSICYSYTMAASGLRAIHEWLVFIGHEGVARVVHENGSHECILPVNHKPHHRNTDLHVHGNTCA